MARTILVVDDEVFILDALRAVLSREGFRTLTAVSGEEALKILDKVEVDVVISDDVMPGMGGIDFLLRVKAKCPDTIRIVLTGFAELDTLLTAVNQAEVHRLIVKPYDHQALVQTVRDLIDRQEEGRRQGRTLEACAQEADFALKALKIICGAPGSPREKYIRLVELTTAYVEADALSLMILYPNRKKLLVQGATNIRLLGITRGLDENAVSAWVAREGIPFRSDGSGRSLAPFASHERALSRYQTDACLSIPVFNHGAVVGVYNVADPRAGSITPRLENRVTDLMRWIGIMIEPGSDFLPC